MRFVWVSAAFVAVLSCASRAEARVPTRLVYLRSQVAAGCPDQAVLEAAVAARLGYEPFSPWGDQTIVATVTRTGAKLSARAELVDHGGIVRGSREVQAAPDQCQYLIGTLALAISITLDPLQAARAPESAPAAPPSDDQAIPALASDSNAAVEVQREVTSASKPVPDPPVEHAEETPPRPPSSQRSTPLKLQAEAGVAGVLDTAPNPTLAGRLGAGLRRGRLGLWAEAWRTLSVSERAKQSSSVRITITAGSVLPCVDVTGPLSLCGLASFGSVRGEGRGVSEPGSRSVFFLTAGARALFELPLGTRLSLLGTLDLSVPLTRYQFALNDAVVWRQPSIAGSGAIALAVQIF